MKINKFIKQIRNFYQAKGTDEAFRILWNVLYGYDHKVIKYFQIITGQNETFRPYGRDLGK